jgi:arsenite methyltransferase
MCEDYGQVALYKGTIPGHKHAYVLDDHHRFVAHKPMLVCGNTAAMVGDSWLGRHFEVTGNRDVHYGLFDCSTAPTAAPAPAAAAGGGGGSCC